MKVKGYPNYLRIESAVRRVAGEAGPWEGVIFRSAPPKWATARNLISGKGSMSDGARFNAPGSFRMVYGSTTPELAMVESLAFQRRAGLPVEQSMPLVFKAIKVKLDRLLDLTRTDVLAAIGITADELANDTWWRSRALREESLTQAVGRAVFAARIQGIVFASAHRGANGRNVAVLPDHIAPNAIRVIRRSRTE